MVKTICHDITYMQVRTFFYTIFHSFIDTLFEFQIILRLSLLDKKHRPLIIAGPCSAETELQVLGTAQKLAKLEKVDLFRAGIWKPRTRPGSFEGVGPKGLPWLQEVKKQTGLPLTVEVAKAAHVELCLKAGIDVLWVGARTTVNPFAVQEIADALRGVDIPVLVKNPINPDLALWLGGMERFVAVGIKRLGAIHRGFSNLNEKYYRNRPQWQLALDFKRELPDIPLINDPSHICGRRDILQEVAQKAMDLNFDGLMIETHLDPDNAWSDAAQQITPETLDKMLSDMVFRNGHEDAVALQSELVILRQSIDNIDEEILNLLSNRMQVARKIGSYKKSNGITILQQKRWNEIIERSKLQGSKSGLSDDFIIRLINAIHHESIEHQEEVFKRE